MINASGQGATNSLLFHISLAWPSMACLIRRVGLSPIVVRQALVFLHPIQEVVRRVAVAASCAAVWEKQSSGGRDQPVQQAKGQDCQLEHQFKGPDGKLDQYHKRPDEEIIAEREKQADHGFLSFFCHYIRQPPDGQSASGPKENGILDQITACWALMPEKEGKRPRRGWSFGEWVDGAQGVWYHRGEAGKRLILQESPLRPAAHASGSGCPIDPASTGPAAWLALFPRPYPQPK